MRGSRGCPEGGSRVRLTIVLVIPEEEQFIANDRSADRTADVVVLESAGGELAWSRLCADERFISSAVERRAAKIVRAALRHHVDAVPNEIALPHVIERDVYLLLLGAFERDRCDVGAVTVI